MKYYDQTTQDVLKELKVTESGLGRSEVEERTAKYGRNVLKVATEPLWRKLIEPFMNVFVAVLLFAAIISAATGHPLDAVIISVIVVVSAIIYYVQMFSTERILRALKKHDSQMVSVTRHGKTSEVDSEELVPGDIFIIGEGEKVPADGRIIHLENLRTDESMLTGESLPVNKHVHAVHGDKPVYERTNMVFQGSYIVAGRATVVVTMTASNTEFGRLAALSVPALETSPAQKKIDYLITRLIITISLVVVVVFALAMYRGVELTEAIRFVLAVAVSAVPEGLPVAIAVILVLGMRRLAKFKALARSMKAIENVGIVTTIATDKTGTLTKNKLTLQHTWQNPNLKTSFDAWVLYATNATKSMRGDPLDAAMHSYATKHVSVPKGRTIEKALPFDQTLAMSGNLWRVGSKYEVVVKGAPEKLLQRSDLDTELLKVAEHNLHHLTGQGFRVIAIARAVGTEKTLENLNQLKDHSFEFLGLIAVADELRDEAKSAISDAQDAGITVRMITGDHAETAFAIGRQLGLVQHRDQVLDCRALDDMSDKALKERVRDMKVFARVVPEDKYRILSALKKTDITAMTGDGVNDVPALTNAHVGVAMGSGSQIAKEAGDIVLLDDNFATIIDAVRQGRVIFDNIRRMLFYLLATSLGQVLVMILGLIFNLPLPLIAVQILWINLATDSLLVIPLGLEPAEDDVMKRRPRAPKQQILDTHMIVRLVAIALTMAVVGLMIFYYYLSQGFNEDYARTLLFNALIIMQWANALNARSEFTSLFTRARVINKPLIFGYSIGLILQYFVLFGPLAALLYVVEVGISDLIATSIIAFVSIILMGELHKALTRWTVKKR